MSEVHTTPKEVRIGHSKPQNAEREQQISDDVISSEFHNQPTDRLESPSYYDRIEQIKSNITELLRKNGGKLQVSRFEVLYKVRFREKFFKALNVPDNGLKGSLRLRKVFEIHFTDITRVDTFGEGEHDAIICLLSFEERAKCMTISDNIKTITERSMNLLKKYGGKVDIGSFREKYFAVYHEPLDLDKYEELRHLNNKTFHSSSLSTVLTTLMLLRKKGSVRCN